MEQSLQQVLPESFRGIISSKLRVPFSGDSGAFKDDVLGVGVGPDKQA